jgi:hypothetical protein
LEAPRLPKEEVSKGKYAGRVGTQDWKTFIIFFNIFARGKEKYHPRVNPTYKPQNRKPS